MSKRKKVTTVWDWQGYWDKARAYVIAGRDRGDDDVAFMYALALEFLARAVLTKIHPALNAHPNDDGVSLLHAFGYQVQGTPQSIQMKTVYARIEKIAPKDFTPQLSSKCLAIAMRRNEELHTAELSFAGLPSSAWLPTFYEAVEVFCGLVGEPVEDLLDPDEAKAARELVAASRGKLTSATRSQVAAFAKVFDAKPAKERIELAKKAEATIVLRSMRHPCPACKSVGALAGRVIRQSKPSYDDDLGWVYVEETHAADSFKCMACGLALDTLEAVVAAGIEPTFRSHASWDPREDVVRENDGPDYDNM
jgi:hypothetical protein